MNIDRMLEQCDELLAEVKELQRITYKTFTQYWYDRLFLGMDSATYIK